MTDFKFTKNVYNQFAGYYAARRQDPKQAFFNNYLSNYQLKRQLKGIIRGKKVLDLGCGHGTFTNELKKMGAKIQGVDNSEKMIQYARDHYKSISFSIANAQKTDFARGCFDLVVSNLMVHYFKNLTPLFREVSRILLPNGIFIFSMHHPFNEIINLDIYKKKGVVNLNPYFHNDQYTWEMGDMKLISYHHTFTEISAALNKAGFVIQEIEESRSPRAGIKTDKELFEFSNAYPTFCIFKAMKHK